MMSSSVRLAGEPTGDNTCTRPDLAKLNVTWSGWWVFVSAPSPLTNTCGPVLLNATLLCAGTVIVSAPVQNWLAHTETPFAAMAVWNSTPADTSVSAPSPVLVSVK